jgi:hypothetical protein
MTITLDKKKTDSKPFNFDLERMKKALAAPSHTMPSNLTFKDFQEWMHNSHPKNINYG